MRLHDVLPAIGGKGGDQLPVVSPTGSNAWTEPLEPVRRANMLVKKPMFAPMSRYGSRDE